MCVSEAIKGREGGIHSGSGYDKGEMTLPSHSPLGAFPLAPAVAVDAGGWGPGVSPLSL